MTVVLVCCWRNQDRLFSSDPGKTLVCAKNLKCEQELGSLLHHMEDVFSREQNYAITQCSILSYCRMSLRSVLENSEQENANIKKACHVDVRCLLTQDHPVHVCCLAMIVFLE